MRIPDPFDTGQTPATPEEAWQEHIDRGEAWDASVRRFYEQQAARAQKEVRS